MGNAGSCAVMLYVGEGPRGSNGACSTLCRFSVTPSVTHNQTGPLWCSFLSGWACAHSRPLWVSPMTSPVRLGVSPAATPTLSGVFNQRFEALFPPLWTPEVCGLLRSSAICPGLSVHECGAVGCYPLLCLPRSLPLCHSKSGPLGLSVLECGATESAFGQTACPVPPTLLQSQSHHSNLSPLCPGCWSPPLLLV